MGVRRRRRLDGTHALHGRSLVGRHPRANKVRYCYGGNDQDDRHNNQELDERETELFSLHELRPRNTTRLSPRQPPLANSTIYDSLSWPIPQMKTISKALP